MIRMHCENEQLEGSKTPPASWDLCVPSIYTCFRLQLRDPNWEGGPFRSLNV
ncbi:hypothetical protein PISMIDRAFT_680275 [Pisolithus microcarpus 441]|uniref:Uncharacterized protein n=1 Tax=Pisolithus microcarpus 441 TaxID=765257 RepID=A0A0C9Z0D2_9AGAM|nr:hypothetical protein PISMIDRAFT_680275 [Pisolithus microcarpus 441]